MADQKKKTGEFIFHKDAPQFHIPEIRLKYTRGKLFSTDKISTAVAAEQVLRPLYDKDEMDLQEQAVVLYLDRANKVIGYYHHSKGGVAQTVMDTRMILAAGIKSLASRIILSHNHPSGTLLPSEADIKITSSIRRAAKDMDIDLTDHIILTSSSFYSFGNEGLLDGLSRARDDDRQHIKHLISELGALDAAPLRTPITYYGGKQKIAKHLLDLIPAHRIYCEPFFGGGALFFIKPKSEVEVINDANGEVVNFYKVMKSKFPELQKEIQATLHSRELYKQAMVVYQNPGMFSDVKRAWALWTAANQGFAGEIGSWGFGNMNSKEKALSNKRDDFTKAYAERLKAVQVEHKDALKVIERCDSKETFIYCDPPYINSDQGHYVGYTEDNYRELLDALSKGKSKFLLSSYPSNILAQYIRKYKWHSKKLDMAIAVTKLTKKRKTEMLVYNFDPAKEKMQVSQAELKTLVDELEPKLKRLKFG